MRMHAYHLVYGCADDDIIRNDWWIDLARDRISSNKHVLFAGRQKLPYKIRENRSFPVEIAER